MYTVKWEKERHFKTFSITSAPQSFINRWLVQWSWGLGCFSLESIVNAFKCLDSFLYNFLPKLNVNESCSKFGFSQHTLVETGDWFYEVQENFGKQSRRKRIDVCAIGLIHNSILCCIIRERECFERISM